MPLSNAPRRCSEATMPVSGPPWVVSINGGHTLTAEAAAAVEASLVGQSHVGFDVILCAGQSNMVGRGAYDEAIDGYDDGRVLQWGCDSVTAATYRQIVKGGGQLQWSEGITTAYASPAAQFARAYASGLAPGRRVLLVPVAQGSTALAGGLAEWSSTGPGTLFLSAVTEANNAIAAALDAFPSSRFAGVIWVQGEQDGGLGVTQATYKTALTSLIEAFRRRIVGASDSWFVIGQMLPELIASASAYALISAAQQEVAASVAKTILVSMPRGYSADGVHYNPAGARLLGRKMAAQVRLAAAMTPPQYSAESTTSVSFAGSTLGSTPINTTANSGGWQALADPTGRTADIWFGSTESSGVASAAITLAAAAPAGVNFSVEWTRYCSPIRKSRDGFVLRKNASNSLFLGLKRGYIFLIDDYYGNVTIARMDGAAEVTIATAKNDAGALRDWKAEVSGRFLKLFYSMDSRATWILAIAGTDSTYTTQEAGGVQFYTGKTNGLGDALPNSVSIGNVVVSSVT